jgi:hypothetical protein
MSLPAHGMFFWVCVVTGAALVVVIELALLDRQRRLLRARIPHPPELPAPTSAPDHHPRPFPQAPSGLQARLGEVTKAAPRRRGHAVERLLTVMHTESEAPPPAPRRAEIGAAAAPEAPTALAAFDELVAGVVAQTHAAEEGIVYIDTAGRLRFASQAARDLLHCDSGDFALSDVLAGGNEAAAALLEAVRHHELIEQTIRVRAGTSAEQMDVTGLALRDQYGNLSGVALFVRRPQHGA